jgi:copper chaperone CopZ
MNMRKSYQLEDLECANCAAKMERDISAFPEVIKCTITFMTSRMSLTVEDGADMDQILDKAQAVMTRYERHCRIVR